MKKKILLSLSLVGLLLSACGENPSPSKETASSGNTPVSTEIASNNQSNDTTTSVSSFSNPVSSSSSAVAKVDIVIINESTGYCTITANDRNGVPGDDATFTVTMKEGYKKLGVSASNNYGSNVALIEDGDTYTFPIQDDGYLYVEVRAEKETVTQKLYVSDPKGFLNGAPIYVTKTGLSPINDYITGEGEPYYKVIANSTIRFTFQNKANFETLGLTFNGRNYTPNANNVVDIDLTGKTGDLRVEVFGKKLGSPLVAVNSEHLTITFMNKSKTEVIDTVVTDVDYVVVITSEDKDIYLLDSLTLAYSTKGSTTVNSYDLTDYVTETATGWELTRKSGSLATDENGYVYTVTEDNLHKYINEPFCGDYLAFSSFTYKDKYYDNENTTIAGLSVAGSGKVNYGSREMKINDYEILESGAYHLKDRAEYHVQEMYFENDCLIAGYGSSQYSFGTPFYSSSNDSLSDDIYAFKLMPNTTTADYTLRAIAFTIGDVTNFLAVLYYHSSYYRAIFTRRDTAKRVREYYLGASVTLLYGNSFYNDQTIFSVSYDNTTLFTFGFAGAGGNKNRTIIPSYGGKYTDGTNSLVLCETVAIYKNTPYVPTFEDNNTKVTLRNSTSTIKLELNGETRRFTVLSSNTKTPTKGPFAGKKYRVNHTDGFDVNDGNGNYGYYMEFDSNNATLSCVADIYWNMTTAGNSQYAFGKTINTEYCYDETTGKITAMIFGYHNEYVIGEFTYANNQISLHVHTLTLDTTAYTDKVITLVEVAE